MQPKVKVNIGGLDLTTDVSTIVDVIAECQRRGVTSPAAPSTAKVISSPSTPKQKGYIKKLKCRYHKAWTPEEEQLLLEENEGFACLS